MTPSTLKKNFLLNLINTLSGVLFPLITFPYASRILLADGIGQIQFFQSIIDYISLFAALGIPLYAVREVARIRDFKQKRSKITFEILLLHAMLTIGGYICIFLLAAFVEKIQVNISLFFLLSLTLFFNAIGVPWFYQAVEDFKYITIRTLVIRILSLISIFIFVKTKSDLMYYAAITVIANVGGNIFNFFRLKKYMDVSLLSLKKLEIQKHLVPALQIFVLNLIVSIYINLDSVMLGFLKDEQAVGYYAGATKLTKAILSVVASFGTVLLPRFSNMIGNKQIEEFNILAMKAVNFTLAVSLPMFVGLFFMAAPIIHLFCGPDFEPSILTLQLLSPIILFIGLSGILGMQILYPQGQEMKVVFSTLTGAILNFSLNWILIPEYAQYGSAFSTCVAEASVLIVMIILGRKYLTFEFLTKQNLHYLIGTIIMFLFLHLLKMADFSEIYLLISGIISGSLIYGGYLYLMKDPFVLQIKGVINEIISRI